MSKSEIVTEATSDVITVIKLPPIRIEIPIELVIQRAGSVSDGLESIDLSETELPPKPPVTRTKVSHAVPEQKPRRHGPPGRLVQIEGEPAPVTKERACQILGCTRSTLYAVLSPTGHHTYKGRACTWADRGPATEGE